MKRNRHRNKGKSFLVYVCNPVLVVVVVVVYGYSYIYRAKVFRVCRTSSISLSACCNNYMKEQGRVEEEGPSLF